MPGALFTEEGRTTAFTGTDEVVLEVWQATFWGGAGIGPWSDSRRCAACGKVRILGSTTGYEGYLRWLAGSMTAPCRPRGQ